MARMTDMPTRTCYDYDYPIASQIFLALSETDYFEFFFSCYYGYPIHPKSSTLIPTRFPILAAGWVRG